MKSYARCVLAPVFVLLLSGILLSQEIEFTEKKAEKIVRSYRPKIEKATDRKFKKKIEVQVVTPEKLMKILQKEVQWKYKGIEIPVSNTRRKDYLNGVCFLLSQSLFGKLAVGEGKFYLVPKNIKNVAREYNDKELLTEKFFTLILVHEAVHVLDDQYYDIRTFFTDGETQTDLLVRDAVLEGHAQYITGKIFSKGKMKKAFDRFSESITELPPGLDKVQKYLANIMMSNFGFAYRQGHVFWKALYRKKAKGLPDRVFKHPPSSPVMVSMPKYYLHPEKLNRKETKATIDSLFVAAREYIPKKLWSHTETEVHLHQLKTALSQISHEEVPGGIHGFQAGKNLMAVNKTIAGTRLNISPVGFVNSSSAKKFYAAEVKLMKWKKKNFKEGNIKIVDASREKKKLGDQSFLNMFVLKMKRGNFEQKVRTTTMVLQKKNFVVEVNVTTTRSDISWVDKITKISRAIMDKLDAPNSNESGEDQQSNEKKNASKEKRGK